MIKSPLRFPLLTWPATALILSGLVGGCAPASGPAGDVSSRAVRASPTSPTTPTPPASPRADASAASPDDVSHDRAAPQQSDRTRLHIPSIGVRDLTVVAYDGRPDDRAGTVIQDGGVAASPRGRLGGVGPGDVGNLIITAHRTSAGAPLRRLPSLRVGAHILVHSAGRIYDYVVTATMTISFRSKASLARQSAAVPGHPGVPATRPMITLSTCATPEDHAQGNYWTDALGNPEHRIDKVGLLTSVRDG